MGSDIIVVNGHGVGQYCDVDHLPFAGETVKAANLRFEEDAGKGTNAAVAIGRMGGSVAFLGKAGNDEAGRLGVKWMTEAGVDVSHFWLDPNISTDLGIVVKAKDGNVMCIDFDDDINNLQVSEAEELLPVMAKDARYLITGYSVSVTTGNYAACRGKQLGLITCLNPSPLATSSDVPNDLHYVDYLFVNETEAHVIMNLPSEEEVDYFLLAKKIQEKYHANNIIITLGSQGSVALLKDGTSFAVPAMKVKMVDQTGAGDGFMAAVVFRLSKGDDIHDALKWATKYCAYLVTQPGSLGSYPTRDVIDKIFGN